MAQILSRVPLTVTDLTLLVVKGAQGSGLAGRRLVFTLDAGAAWSGSAVLKINTGAPGQAVSLTNIPYLNASTGATVSAGTAITTTGGYIVADTYNGYDVYVAYTHTSGSAVVTVLTEDAGTGDATNIGDATANSLAVTTNATVGGTLAVTGALTATAGMTAAGDVSTSKTISSATPSTERLTQSEITLSATSIAVSGSLAGVRGGITVSSGKTFTEGFLYGTQGKVTLSGTMHEGAAARIAGVIGQVDLASGTVTSGQVSGVWADIQSTAPTLTDPSEINLIRATNSMAGTSAVNAVLFAYGRASLFAQLGADGGAANVAYWGTVAPTSLAKSLKINGPDGVDYYIGLYSAAS